MSLVTKYDNHFKALRARMQGGSKSQVVHNGNLARIEIFKKGSCIYSADAFSISSSLPAALRDLFVGPVSDAELDDVGVPRGAQHGNHTEPKLFVAWRKSAAFKSGCDRIELASEMDCCASCVKNPVKALTAISGLIGLSGAVLDVIVVETGSRQVRNSHDL